MPTVNHQAWYGDNIGSPAGGFNFGPYTPLASVSRLLRVRAVMGFSFPGTDLLPSASLYQNMSWGVQAYIAGYTPLVLPADMGGYTFLWSELAAMDTYGGAAWTPPTDNVGWIGSVVAFREWRGQIPIGNPVDLYIGYGNTVSGGANFSATWSMEIDYSE